MTTSAPIPNRIHITGVLTLDPATWTVGELEEDCALGDEWPVSGDNIARYRKALAS